MSNKILPVQKEETVNYGKEKINDFWMLKDGPITRSTPKQFITQFIKNTDSGFICIYSEKITDNELINLLFNIAEKIRVYILVNDYSQELLPIVGKSLIRYSGVKNKGTFILKNPKSDDSEGLFFGGQLTNTSLSAAHFLFETSKNDIKELFRHYCYQFWSNAKTEIVEDTPQDVHSKPIDVFYDDNKFNGKDYVYGTLFKFVKETERQNIVGQKIVYLNQENISPIEIIASSFKELGDNKIKELLPKTEYEEQKPVFKDDGVSEEITYSWRNVPFYLPENAKDHNLYTQWNDEKIKIKSKLDSLITKIEESEQKEKTISSRIKRFFLGKKNLFSNLKEQLLKIKEVDFANLSKNEKDEKINKVNEIYREIVKQSKEIDVENKKALIDDEIENLAQELNDKNNFQIEIEKKLSEKRKNRESKICSFCKQYEIESESKIQEWQDDLRKQAESIKTHLVQSEKEKKALLEKKSFLEDKLENIKAKLDMKKNNDEKNMEEKEKVDLQDDFDKKNGQLNDSLEKIGNLSDIIEMKQQDRENIENKINLCKKFQEEIRNENVFIQKVIDEKNKIIKEKERIENSINAKKDEKEKIEKENIEPAEKSSLDVFSKKKQSNGISGKFDIQNIPQLPQIGKLFSYERNTYLAIEYWEDYNLGKQEAERFNAKLCAIK